MKMAFFSRLANPLRNGMSTCVGATRSVRVRVSQSVKAGTEDVASRYDRYGRLFLGSACVAGLGGMCAYGISHSSTREMSSLERSVAWSPVVRQRIRTTFTYFTAGLATTAAGVVALHRTGASIRLMQTMSQRPFLSMIVPLGAMVATNGMNAAIPYKQNRPNFEKFGLLLVCNGIVAAIVSPLTVLGGPLLMRAAAITGGAMGALAMTAMCAPSQQFLNYGAPLSLALGGMALATLGSAFLPVGGAAAAGFHAVYVYGGLVLFGGLTIYDFQRIIHRAETAPGYDPIVSSLALYMDAVNIFIRVAMMLAGNRRK